jgi:hypothetical protein
LVRRYKETMVSRTKWVLGGLVVSFGLVGVMVALWVMRPQYNITQEAFDALDYGMDESQIEALLGGPASGYRTGDVFCTGFHARTFVACGPDAVVPVRSKTRVWHGDDGTVVVVFDQHGGVMELAFSRGEVSSFDVLLVVRRLLHLN